MNLSLDEYRALVAKAFRGVGYVWGLTEDASWAARRLAEVDGSSPDGVISLLEQIDSSSANAAQRMPGADWTCSADALCPVCVGTSLLDRGSSVLDEPLTFGSTLTPELLAPFLAELVRHTHGIEATWDSGGCRVERGAIALFGSRTPMASSVTITKRTASERSSVHDADAQTSSNVNSRVVLQTEQVLRLEHFAHRIYAPATEESRAGAGAGTSDND